MGSRLLVSAVYVIEHASGVFYIGASSNVRRRWSLHQSHLRHGKHHSPTLQRIADAEGVEAFTVRPLLIADRSVLPMYEDRVLRTFKHRPGFCNGDLHASSNAPRSESFKARLSARRTGQKESPEVSQLRADTLRRRYANGEITISDETRKKLATWTGRRHTAETRAKMSASMKGRKRSLEACANIRASKLGTRHTEEHCAKIAAGLRAYNARLREGA
jgi:group I intron endonuclease